MNSGRRLNRRICPPVLKKIADRELELMCRMSPATAEYTIGLTYVDYLVSLPWNRKTADNLDLTRAQKILDEAALWPERCQGKDH